MSVQVYFARWVKNIALLFQYILCVGSSQVKIDVGDGATWFQYILCVCSSLIKDFPGKKFLLFQYILCVGSRLILLISIARVVCFNTSYVSVQDQLESIFGKTKIEFQYILCVGSRESCSCSKLQNLIVSIHPMCRFKLNNCFYTFLHLIGFNTSYVSVQVFSLNCSAFSNSVSIHPMCRFKSGISQYDSYSSSFQYILCVGSSLYLYHSKSHL